MNPYIVDASDPGKAACLTWGAAVLGARVAGMVATNMQRESNGHAMAYTDDNFEGEVREAWESLVAMGAAKGE